MGCCERIKIGEVTAIICGLRTKKQPCAFCGRLSTKQCDFPIEDGKTCDAYMCDSCSVPVGENLDHCIGHSRVGKRYAVLVGRHEGHVMKLLAWRKVPKYSGARERVWKYASQCSCFAAGDLEQAHLALLDLTKEVA